MSDRLEGIVRELYPETMSFVIHSAYYIEGGFRKLGGSLEFSEEVLDDLYDKGVSMVTLELVMDGGFVVTTDYSMGEFGYIL